MWTHSGERERPHVCETCNKAFTTSSDLNVHIRTHSGEMPHVCETCGKAFTAASSLKRHKRTHANENTTREGPAKVEDPYRTESDEE